ncbi:MAG: redoxin domain-containing protein [Planctomycetaceae bacterium]|nr:redoxin domain-containing protein [Planctomycetaceae bacterium]
MSRLSARTFAKFLCLIAPICIGGIRPAYADDATPPAEATPPLADPSLLLVRDAAVRDELKLSPAQREQLDALLLANNRLLIAIRDVGPNGADETAQSAIAELRAELRKIFTPQQKLRLQGLILQAQGYDALLRKDITARLKITPDQQAKLAAIAADARASVQSLNESRSSLSPDELKQQLAQIQTDRLQKIVAELNDEQESLYGKLLGQAFDFSMVRASPGLAPEFTAIDEWINSEPVTIESLRGKVVVVHFFAFGCINCIHNYPWYKQWHDAYQGQDVAIIGIHTPETETETDNDLLRASLEKNGLKFPVAVDKQKAMWKAWYNNMWPSVYIIDKRGRLRYWWYGELDWEGAGNQQVARQQIDQLLAEEDGEKTK